MIFSNVSFRIYVSPRDGPGKCRFQCGRDCYLRARHRSQCRDASSAPRQIANFERFGKLGMAITAV
jgi:hypothetical protein